MNGESELFGMILDASHIFLVLLQQQHMWKKYFKEKKEETY